MGSTLSSMPRLGACVFRTVAGVVLSCLSAGIGHAQTDGIGALSNGAVVEWRVESGGDGPMLGLAVPAFAQWTKSAFDEPVVVEMRSDAHAVVDAWQLAFYRAGDTGFARPLRRFRGDAATLGDPVEWDGRVESGPALRPGETVVALFETRDVAGNIDRAAPQEMLVSRYTMRAERRGIASDDTARARGLAEGEAPVPRGIPVRGSVLTLTVTDWLDSQGPRASGVRFRKRGTGWTLRQTLPPGRHEVVIQSARPIVGGVRAIPVGVVTVDAPPAQPFHAGVKGTGRLVKSPLTAATLTSDDFLPRAMVPGRAAISRPLTNRDAGEDRLALSLIAADAPVTLAADRRKRLALLSGYGGTEGAWPRAAPTRALADPSTRRMSMALPVPVGRALTLPHTDIVRGSLSLTPGDGGAPLVPVRDYEVNDAEGRVVLTPPALSRLALGATVTAAYDVPIFAAEAFAGAAQGDTWARAASAPKAKPAAEESTDSVLERAVRWLFGEG